MLSPTLATSTAVEALTQLGPLALFGLAYAKRVHTLGRQGRPVPGWRQACFYGGFLTIGAALTSLGGDSEELLTAHMVEHLLLGDIAALLIVLGLTGPLIAPILRVKLFDRLRILAHPLIAFPLWALDLYVWHLPVFYEAALRHTAVHALQHAMFLGFGINMWMCLFGPLPMPAWFGNLAKLGYIVAVRLTGTVLGNVFLWSGSVFYPFYTHGDAIWHVSPIADQHLGNLGIDVIGTATGCVKLLGDLKSLQLDSTAPAGSAGPALSILRGPAAGSPQAMRSKNILRALASGSKAGRFLPPARGPGTAGDGGRLALEGL